MGLPLVVRPVKEGLLVGLAQAGDEGIVGQGRPPHVPVGVGVVVEDLVLLPEGGEQVEVGHPLSLQIGDQPVDVVLPLQGLPHMGQVLRVETGLVGGHRHVQLGPPALGVLPEQGQGAGRPEELLLAQGIGAQVVVQGLPVEEPVLPPQHHVLLGRTRGTPPRPGRRRR